ncbi:MAG: glycosyltransferase [Terriglobia bacterium]
MKELVQGFHGKLKRLKRSTRQDERTAFPSPRTIRERLRPWYLRNVFFPLFPAGKPAYFDAPWSYPNHLLVSPLHTDAEKLRPMLSVSQGYDFLFLPMSDWHFRLQRPQFLMQALAARGHRCFFLNPHLGRQFPGARIPSPRIGRLGPNLFELHVRLPLEPVYHHRMLHPEESLILADAVENLRQIGVIPRFMQVVGSPVWGPAAQLIRQRSGSPIVYDCHDLITGLSSTHTSIQYEEAAMISASDFVVCSSMALRDHCLKLGASPARTAVIRNAARPQPHEPAQVNSQPCHQPPRIGYVGALEDWFDVASLREAAVARPGWKFLLAGRRESRHLDEIRRLPNVEFCGEIPADKVPSFLAGLDVALIPFLLTDLTRAVDPIKLYEYLSAGIPVVASRLPETFRFAPLLHYYEGASDFVGAIEGALADRSTGRSSNRREAVANETWDARAGELLNCAAAVFDNQAG